MPPSCRLNNIIARTATVRSSTLLRNSSVPAEVIGAPAPAPATNIQVINPTDAGYRLDVNDQATEPVQLPTRKPFNLIYGPRPVGTAGREDFPLKDLLGLSTYEYLLCLKTMRNVSYLCGIDDTLALSFQDEHRLFHAYNKFIEALPEFKGFSDRYWAPRAIMYVTLKSSSEAWRRNNPESAAARAAARAMEKAALKAAALAKKVKRPRGRPKGKGKAKSQVATPRQATVESAANDFDEIADDFGNMSLEPDIAAGLANMSVDARADEEEDVSNQPFFDSPHSLMGGTLATRDLPSSPYATSTPLAPARLPTQDVGSSSHTTISNSIGKSTIGTSHTPAPSQVLSRTYTSRSTVDINHGTHKYSTSQLNRANSYAQVTGISNHPSIAPAQARAFDSNHMLNSSLLPPLVPHSSRPPPIPHSSRPLTSYSNSFSLSAPPNLHSLPTPIGSRDPTPSPNTTYSGTQGIDYARATPDPGPVTYLNLTQSRSLPHIQAPLAHLPTNSAPHDAPTRSRDATPRLVSAHSTNTSRAEVARPVIVDLASQVPFAQKAGRPRTNYHASSHPRAPASIVMLSDTSPYTQVAEESNAHPVAAFDDGELSDAPSATASNKPVDSDVDIAATTTASKKAPKKNSKIKAQSVHPDEERPEEQAEIGTPQGSARSRGRGRGRGRGCGRGRGRGEHHGHIEDPSLDDNHTHEEDNSRGKGRGRGRAGRARGGGRARG